MTELNIFLTRLLTGWHSLTEAQQAAFASVAGLAVALLLFWLLASFGGRRARRDAAQLRDALADGRATAQRDAERLAHRDDRIRQLEADLAETRSTCGEAQSTGARHAEAVVRLEQAAERAAAEIAALQHRHLSLQEAHGALQREHSRLQADSDGKLAAAELERCRLTELREEMTRTFQELANAALRRTGADFSKAHEDKLRELLTPFREQVGKFESELAKVHQDAAKDRVRLQTEIEQLSRRSEEVSREAVALTEALKGEKQKQGAWGEMLLQSVLENSGLVHGREFRTQFSVTTDEGRRLRPDAVIHLPGGRNIVIDSKVSLVAYEAASRADDPDERARQVRAHTAAVEKHIADLADRDYSAAIDGAVDYTLMFMPVEAALAMALEGNPHLTASAIARRVGIATPTTLMLALRTIEHVWAVEHRETNAEEIARRAGLLYDKVSGFADNMKKVGDHLGSAVRVHEEAFDQLARGSGNLLRQTEMLKELGARTKKNIGVAFERDAEDVDPLLPVPEPAE